MVRKGESQYAEKERGAQVIELSRGQRERDLALQHLNLGRGANEKDGGGSGCGGW